MSEINKKEPSVGGGVEIEGLVFRYSEVFRIMAENFEILAKTENINEDTLERLWWRYSFAGLVDFAHRTLSLEERVSRRQYEAIMFYVGVQAVKTNGKVDVSMWIYDCTKALRNISMPLEKFRANVNEYPDGQFWEYEAQIFRDCYNAIKDLNG